MASTRVAARTTAGTAVEHRTVSERVALGKAARELVPRSRHGEFQPASSRPDPVALLERQAESRVPELVPIRYGRMLGVAVRLLPGSGADHGRRSGGDTRDSGLRAQLCGDAHLANFGVFASPERRLVFELNDFDETLPGPWEWDVKRLAASLVVAGRDNGYTRRAAATVVARQPCASTARRMRQFAGMAQPRGLVCPPRHRRRLEQAARRGSARSRSSGSRSNLAKARTRDSMHAFSKLTHLVDGEPRIISDPPLIVPVEELFPGIDGASRSTERVRDFLRGYRRSLQTDRRALVEQFRFVAPGPQGGRRRQRRHPGLDRAVPGRRRRRPAVPAGEGGAAVGARGVPRQERVRQPRRARGGGPAPDAGVQRHLPGLAADDRHGGWRRRATSTCAS